MKLKFKKCSSLAAASIVLLLLLDLSSNNNRVECLFIIPSMLMAMTMTGGLLMGKMTMGGLLMMLMAANNQQQNGQNFLRNLGLVPHPSPSTGISVPTTSTSTEGFVQDLIVRRRRDISLVKNKDDAVVPAKDNKVSGVIIDEVTQYRIMRQVASSDPLSCLPSALCGISAAPPSTQSGFLNDYAYLLKTVFSRDDDLDDDLTEFDELTSSKKKKKNTKNKSSSKKSEKSKTKKKNSAVNDDEESKDDEGGAGGESSEEEDVDEDDIKSQRRKEAIEMSDMANEEILTNNPDYMPYAMRDTLKNYGVKGGSSSSSYDPSEPEAPPQPPEGPPGFMDLPPGDINHMTEAELDDFLYKLGGPPPSSSNPEPQRPGSLLSKIMPQLSLGFTGKGSDTKFDDDPFFAGFKRGMEGRQLEVDSASIRPATAEEEKLFEELRLKRQRRREYITQKRKELSEIKDPVEKFRIAAEFGQKLKSPRQCRLLFNSCPFNYTQVLGMVADLRNVIMGQPINNVQQSDTVVNLKPASTDPPSGSSKNVINLNAGTASSGGVTSIIHQLPSGEKVEISLKMTKGGLTTTATRKTKGSTNSTNISSNEAAGFEADDQDNNESSSSSSSTPVHSIESLKATMMAIQKINNVTIQRTKHGKPISFSHILADLSNQQNKENTSNATSSTPSIPNNEDIKLPEPDPIVLTKLVTQNSNKKKHSKNSNNPQKTASLLASIPLSKVEDDEVDDNIPTSLIGIKRKTSSGPKSNQELSEILARLKETKKRINKNKQNQKAGGGGGEFSEEEEEEEEQDEQEYGDDEEEDEMEDTNKMYKSDQQHRHKAEDRDWDHKSRHHQVHLRRRPAPRMPIITKRRGGIENPNRFTFSSRQGEMFRPILKHVSLRQQMNARKPKKLFMGHDISLPRSLPL